MTLEDKIREDTDAKGLVIYQYLKSQIELHENNEALLKKYRTIARGLNGLLIANPELLAPDRFREGDQISEHFLDKLLNKMEGEG